MIRLLAGVGCLVAAGLTAAVSWADLRAWRDTPEGLGTAARLQASIGFPNATVLERLAERRRWDVQDRDLTLLRESIQVNPRLTSARIQLALAQESAGNFEAAEASLLEAARFDRQHLPAWTLANYYFRRDQRDRFWTWASRAAELTYDDFRPLLRLVDEYESSPAAALARLQAGANQPSLERAYLNHLIAGGRLDAAEFVAFRLAADARNRARIADLVDRDIRAGRLSTALQLWKKIGGDLDPAHDKILTNGGFDSAPTGVAFDWKLRPCDGAVARWSPGRMEFEFSGVQSDTCVLLEQPVPKVRGRAYSAIIDSAPPILTAKLDVSLRIVLVRTPGTVPYQGSLVIRAIRVQSR